MNDIKSDYQNIAVPANDTGPALKIRIIRGGHYDRFNTARLCISVGQEYHEGEKLKAAFQWAATRFERVVVSVADTLQRHNMNGHDTRTVSRMAGDAWLARNADAFALIPNAEIQRWDNWLAHPDYAATRQVIETVYARHEGFRTDIDAVASAYAARHGTPESACRNYLLEETAVFAIQQAVDPAADIYPGSLTIWNRFCKEKVEGAPESLSRRHYTRVGFKAA